MEIKKIKRSDLQPDYAIWRDIFRLIILIIYEANEEKNGTETRYEHRPTEIG